MCMNDCLRVCICTMYMLGTHGGHKGMLGLLSLGLKTLVICHVSVGN